MPITGKQTEVLTSATGSKLISSSILAGVGPRGGRIADMWAQTVVIMRKLTAPPKTPIIVGVKKEKNHGTNI